MYLICTNACSKSLPGLFNSYNQSESHMKSKASINATGIISMLHEVMALLFLVAYVSSLWSSVMLLSPLCNSVSMFCVANLVCLFLSPHDAFSINSKAPMNMCNTPTFLHLPTISNSVVSSSPNV